MFHTNQDKELNIPTTINSRHIYGEYSSYVHDECEPVTFRIPYIPLHTQLVGGSTRGPSLHHSHPWLMKYGKGKTLRCHKTQGVPNDHRLSIFVTQFGTYSAKVPQVILIYPAANARSISDQRIHSPRRERQNYSHFTQRWPDRKSRDNFHLNAPSLW